MNSKDGLRLTTPEIMDWYLGFNWGGQIKEFNEWDTMACKCTDIDVLYKTWISILILEVIFHFHPYWLGKKQLGRASKLFRLHKQESLTDNLFQMGDFSSGNIEYCDCETRTGSDVSPFILLFVIPNSPMITARRDSVKLQSMLSKRHDAWIFPNVVTTGVHISGLVNSVLPWWSSVEGTSKCLSRQQVFTVFCTLTGFGLMSFGRKLCVRVYARLVSHLQ